MLRGRRPSSVPQAQSVNLYCTHCEVQIGIFDNEWIRLTSSYARSKEKGTHFGTQVGERIQVVPPGAVQRNAIGCRMAEVFCRKCSNMVGQYCKAAPDACQQEMVNQYYYKLSRTFLKDSKTNDKVDAVFSFDGAEERPDSAARPGSTPVRWQNTPLRESSSTPVTVQTAARNRTNYLNPPNAPNLRLNHEAGIPTDNDPAPMATEPPRLDNPLNSFSGSSHRQSTRFADREGRMFEIEGRLRFQDGRLMDQENFLNDISARLHEQDNVIEEQRLSLEEQDAQLVEMREQITTLQQATDGLRASLLLGAGAVVPESSSSHIDFAGQLELFARIIRSASNVTEEIETLRAENRTLRSRLEPSTEVDSIADAVEQTMEASSSTAMHIATSLGKRKRDGQSVGQMLTPQSDRSTQPSPIQPKEPAHTGPVIAAAGDDQIIAEVGSDTNKDVPENAIRGKAAKQGASRNVSKAQTQSDSIMREGLEDERRNEPTVESTVERGQMSTELPKESLLGQYVGVPDDADASMDWMDDDDPDQIGMPATTDLPNTSDHHMEFVQDPAAFDDLDFSDEEDEDNDTEMFNGERSQIGDIAPAEEAGNIPVVRDSRSTAPEPFLKPKAPANRMRSYITLDRAHIATPWTFWTAIANGQQPKLIKPPAIQTRKKDLEDELIALGLREWIGRDKKSKEYREAVNAARTKLRNEKRAAMLASRGLKPVSVDANQVTTTTTSSSVLSTIHNVRANEQPPNAAAGQAISGDENSQSISASQQKESQSDVQNETATSSRTTRRRAPSTITPAETTDATNEEPSTAQDAADVELPKRQRKPTERAKAQRKSDVGESQQATAKRPRGRPRKSAPAALIAATAEANVTDASQVPTNPAPEQDEVADTISSQALGSTSPSTLSANKQQLLEKMRLKAQQKDRLREEMIMARDKLAEEAMAALEMEQMAA